MPDRRPAHFLVLPWSWLAGLRLPDHLRCTYETILSLAWSHDGVRTPPISRRELARLRGVAIRTIDEHLQALRQGGHLADEPGRAGRKLVLLPTLPRLAESPSTMSGGPSRSAAADAAHDHAPGGVHSASDDIALRPVTGHALECTSHDAAPSPGLGSPPRSTATPAPDCSASTVKYSKEYDKDTQGTSAPPEIALEEEGRSLKETEDLLLTTELLATAGVYAGLAQQLARRSWVTPGLVRAWVAALKRERRVRHLGAVLATILRDPERCLPPPSLPESGPVASPLPLDLDDKSAGGPEPVEAAPNELCAPWAQALALLRTRIGRERVDLWLADSDPVSWADGVLVVAVRSKQAADWLESCHDADVRWAAQASLGQSVRVRFVVGRRSGLAQPTAAKRLP